MCLSVSPSIAPRLWTVCPCNMIWYPAAAYPRGKERRGRQVRSLDPQFSVWVRPEAQIQSGSRGLADRPLIWIRIRSFIRIIQVRIQNSVGLLFWIRSLQESISALDLDFDKFSTWSRSGFRGIQIHLLIRIRIPWNSDSVLDLNPHSKEFFKVWIWIRIRWNSDLHLNYYLYFEQFGFGSRSVQHRSLYLLSAVHKEV